MNFRKRATVGLTAAILLGSGLALAPAASATPTAASAAAAGTARASAVKIAGTAPSCVKRDVIKHKKYVKVTNRCHRAMHLKVVIDWGPDSRCLTYQHGEQWEWHWGRGSYGKVVTC
ncbi:hypothetical protein [Streptomyces varsoviensis]|uniref:Uncharacterized protein n=1 Tax=Streptomyces varsoviensis TaxID=67373 RepID=A0ABR5J940_9ACTN|nr:hypothetical protein [Streptomyces varsoviensis]KOG89939.1 hypothetical protein ADK38_11455 [Streptomyces varsoviensis]